MARGSTWTDEMQELLTTMWAQGLSSGMIALEFNKRGYRVTRNAIIGRAYRTKLPTPEVPKKKLLPPQNISGPRTPGRRSVQIHELEDHHCRAILGYENGEKAKAIYCGEQAAPKVTVVRGRLRQGYYSWCHYHHGRYIRQESSQ